MSRLLSFPAVALAVAITVIALVQVSVADAARARASTLVPAFLKKKTYTPLLFFKVPLGTMDECEYYQPIEIWMRNFAMHLRHISYLFLSSYYFFYLSQCLPITTISHITVLMQYCRHDDFLG